jgi:hypothetical protein
MAINKPTISAEDGTVLKLAYQTLLENRQAMIDGMASLDDSPFFRGVIVDSVISGLMAHFHELARNTSVHLEEIRGWGGTFANYVNDRTSQASVLFVQLPKIAPVIKPKASQGRPPGKR